MDIDSNAEFSGDNAAESRFFNAYTQAFYPMEYKPRPDVPYVFSDYLAKLNTNRDKVKALIAPLDPEKRSRYNELTDAYYNDVLITLLSMNKDSTDKARIDSIVATVDPNSDVARKTGLLTHWYNASDLHKSGRTNNVEDYLVDQFAAIDSVITNEGNKKSLWYSLGSMYMMFRPSDEAVEAFFASVEPQLSKVPGVKTCILQVREDMTPKVKDGDPIPTDPILIAPDGSRCQLSHLLGKDGKFISIDAQRPSAADITEILNNAIVTSR
ncbi:MAG: hypothetical protein NC411_10915 [Bacteroides sp.]|nr:hypothetical protein [Bacteroides sp.]